VLGGEQAELTEVLTSAPFMGNVTEPAVPGRGDKVLFPVIGAQRQSVHHAGRLVFISVHEDDRDRKAAFGFRYTARDVTVLIVRNPDYGPARDKSRRAQGLFCLYQPGRRDIIGDHAQIHP
jgi:hypothetical protein